MDLAQHVNITNKYVNINSTSTSEKSYRKMR